MRLIASLPELETAAIAVPVARPTTGNHGVDITAIPWIQGGRLFPRYATLFVLTDGNVDVLDSPTGGAHGAELWQYVANKANVKHWFRFRELGAVAIPASGGVSILIDLADAQPERLALVGTGGHAQTYWFSPLEAIDHGH